MAFNEFLIGKRERMSWIVETSFGSGGTMSSGEIIGPDCVVTPDFSKGWQEILTAGADNRLVQSRVKGPKTLPYTMNFSPVNWRWFKYLMDVADGDDAGTKTHTFTMRNTILSYKMEWAKRHTTSHVITLTGNVVKSATIRWAKATGEGTEGHVKVELDCVGKDNSSGSSVTSLSSITSDPFQYRSVKLTLNNSEVVEVNNGDMTIAAGIDEADSRYCNSTLNDLLGEPIPKVFRVSGRFNVNIKDSTFYDLWEAGVVVPGTNTLLFDRDATGNDQMLFTFSNLIIHGGVAPTNIEGVTNVDLVWTAYGFTSCVARDAITNY